jgi:predicted Zn-dependent peptidase
LSALVSVQTVVHTLSNGLTVIVEPMAGVRSAAMSLWVPCGGANDPVGQLGTANVLSDLTLRGAGGRTSRQLSDDLDRLGLQRDSSAGLYHTRYSAAATSANLLAGIPLFADIIRAPVLGADDFEACRQLALQELDGLDDDPRSEALIALRQHHWPEPLGRNVMGEVADLDMLSLDLVRDSHAARFVPAGSILGLAGDLDPKQAIDIIEKALGDWAGSPPTPIRADEHKTSDAFIERQTEQTHIGIACPYIREVDDDYYIGRVAAEVLSGGSSGRLFTEIREIKGLCYSVGTSYASLKDRASLLGYAGTSNERAQATLDAFLHELRRIGEGVEQGEVERAKIGLMSGTVMSGESTGARASAVVSDYFSRGRVRPLEEIASAIDAVTVDQVDDFVRRTKLGPFTVVTVGPKELEINGDLGAKLRVDLSADLSDSNGLAEKRAINAS